VLYLCFLGAAASRRASGKPALLCRTNLRGQCFVTGGDGISRVWKVIPEKKQAEAVDVKFGLVKRNIISMAVIYQSIWGWSDNVIRGNTCVWLFSCTVLKTHTLCLRVAVRIRCYSKCMKLVLIVQLDGASLSRISDLNTEFLCFCWWWKEFRLLKCCLFWCQHSDG